MGLKLQVDTTEFENSPGFRLKSSVGILEEIVRKRRQRIEASRSRTPLRDLKARIPDRESPLDFLKAVRRPEGTGIRLIAEVKRASPTAGVIREDFIPRDIALAYRGSGANAISVLTEEDYFRGSLSYLREVKEASGLPVLRKDFIVDEYQIYEARASGADAILLINEILDPSQAGEYLHMAQELGMACLYEVHGLGGLERALRVGAGLIGINNRDLTTMTIDLDTTFRLMREVTAGKVVVSESGISTRAHVEKLEEAGIDAVLIGTTFMRSPDIGATVKELLGG